MRQEFRGALVAPRDIQTSGVANPKLQNLALAPPDTRHRDHDRDHGAQVGVASQTIETWHMFAPAFSIYTSGDHAGKSPGRICRRGHHTAHLRGMDVGRLCGWGLNTALMRPRPFLRCAAAWASQVKFILPKIQRAQGQSNARELRWR